MARQKLLRMYTFQMLARLLAVKSQRAALFKSNFAFEVCDRRLTARVQNVGTFAAPLGNDRVRNATRRA
jgi:hypothetical protein